jgi:hypothetical protein
MRIGFNAYPEPVFISMGIQIRMHEAKAMGMHADPDPYQRLFERQQTRFICKYCKFPYSWITIRIPNTDPDPGSQFNADPCGSRFTTLRKIN